MANEKEYNFNFVNEQTAALYQTLYQQAFDQYGTDCYYMPLAEYEEDELNVVFQEVKEKNYDSVYMMRMMMEDVTMLGGQGDLFSKFGLEVQDEVTLYITRKEFIERITGDQYDLEDGLQFNDDIIENDTETHIPKISDLIWIPIWNSLFAVTFVEHQENKFTGHKAFWKLICKKHTFDTAERILIGQTGEGESVHVDAPDISEEVDKLNEMDEARREEREIEMDPDATGFDQSGEVAESAPLNDDYEKLAEDIKDDSEGTSPFSQW